MRYFRSTYCKQLTANKADANTYVSVKSTVTIISIFMCFASSEMKGEQIALFPVF